MSQSTDIAVRSTGDLANVEEWIGELETYLRNEADPESVEQDAGAISDEIVAQLLGAESDEQLFSFGTAIGWRTLLGIPVEVSGFSWRPSDYDEGASIFFVVQGTRLDTGEGVVLTTGSRTCMAQLANLAKRNRLPITLKAVQTDRPTRGGFYPMQLEMVVDAEPTSSKK